MRNAKEAGFSLIEVLVASVVITIIFTSILSLFTTLRQVNARAHNLTLATQLVQREMETFRNTPYTNIAVGTVDFSNLLTPYKTMANPKTGTVTITQSSMTGVKQVDIKVQYTEHKSLKTVQTTTLIYENGINK
jgi:prepilin-type N-terminal cleavage/methylation domain-containing protein